MHQKPNKYKILINVKYHKVKKNQTLWKMIILILQVIKEELIYYKHKNGVKYLLELQEINKDN